MASIKRHLSFTVTSALLGTGLAVSSGCTEKPPIQVNPGPVEVSPEEKEKMEQGAAEEDKEKADTASGPESAPGSAPDSAKAPGPIINPGPVPVPVEPPEAPEAPKSP